MSKIEETEDRLSNRDISPDSFNSMVNRYQSNLMLVNADIEALSIKDDSIKGHIDDGLEMLLNLNKMFLETDYDGKRIIAGSLFTGKVVVGNNKCRTTQVNEVIELFTRNFKDWEINSNEKAVTNDGLSSSVPLKFTLSNRFIDDLKKLSNAYKVLIKNKQRLGKVYEY
jgi:hypothetical protein